MARFLNIETHVQYQILQIYQDSCKKLYRLVDLKKKKNYCKSTCSQTKLFNIWVGIFGIGYVPVVKKTTELQKRKGPVYELQCG